MTAALIATATAGILALMAVLAVRTLRRDRPVVWDGALDDQPAEVRPLSDVDWDRLQAQFDLDYLAWKADH